MQQNQYQRSERIQDTEQESGYVKVYESRNNPPSKVPANPMVSIVGVGGLLLLLAGVGSTVFGSFQNNQNIEQIKAQAVQQALLEQQDKVATCMNAVFDGKSPTKTRHKK